MRKSLSVSILLLALCCPAMAGDMLTPPVATPPPTATSVTTSSALCPDGESTAPADDLATQDISVSRIAVSIFESLLALL